MMKQNIKFSLSQKIKRALQFHQQGKLDEAAKIYTKVLNARPDHFDALHLFGVLKYQTGKLEDALDLIASALKVNRNSAGLPVVTRLIETPLPSRATVSSLAASTTLAVLGVEIDGN